MSLWVNTSCNGTVKWSDARFMFKRNIDKVFLLFGGKSLASVNIDALRKVKNSIIMATSRIDTASNIFADAWYVPTHPCSSPEGMIDRRTPVIYRANFRDTSTSEGKLSNSAMSLFIDHAEYAVEDGFNARRIGVASWRNSTFASSLTVATVFGPKEIIILGADFRVNDRFRPSLRRWKEKVYEKDLCSYPKIKDSFAAQLIKLTNCSPGRLAEIEYDHIDKYIENEYTPTMSHMNTSSSGILTGCDRYHEWMLPNFLHYAKENSPGSNICICDFGLSEECLGWLKSKGQQVIKCQQEDLNTWHRKWNGIDMTPFKHNAWIDVDCEIMKDISRLISPRYNIGVCKDTNNGEWNAGVLLFDRESVHIERIIRAVRNKESYEYMMSGDQGLITDMNLNFEVYIEDVPLLQNICGKDGVIGEGAYIRHYVMGIGKRILAGKIELDKNVLTETLAAVGTSWKNRFTNQEPRGMQ
jgi:hypothetical protein